MTISLTEMTSLSPERGDILIHSCTEMMRHYLEERFPGNVTTPRGKRINSAIFAANPESKASDSEFSDFLNSLQEVVPESLVILSSTSVYGKKDGEEIDEKGNIWPSRESARSLARMEEIAKEYGRKRGIPVAILRAAPTFGNDIEGAWERLFASVSTGRFILARDCGGEQSLITAYDAARCVKALIGHDGIYNLTDGKSHSVVSIVSAMAQNGGKDKRPIWLPLKWYKLVAKLGDRIPALGTCASSRALLFQQNKLTFSNNKLREVIDFELFDTTAVISHTEKNYPYEDS